MRLFLSNETDFTSNGHKFIESIFTHEIRNNSEWYLDVRVPLEFIEFIEQDNIVVVKTKEKGKQPFRIKDITVGSDIRFEAWHIGFDTKVYTVSLSTVINLNCQNAINEILGDTQANNFTSFSDIGGSQSFSIINMTLYEALIDIASRYNGFLDFDGWQIRILSSIGSDKGVTIAYGKNLESAEVEERWDMVCTELQPLGNNGLVGSTVFSSIQYDRPYAKIVSFDTDDLTTLNNLASAYVSRFESPQMYYKVGANVDGGLGDTIQVKARQFAVFTQVLGYKFNIKTQQMIEIEFGNFRPTIRNALGQLRTEVVEQSRNITQLKIDEVNNEITAVVSDLEDAINLNSAQLTIQSNEIATKVNATYVDNKIAEINSASPNRVSNLPANYDQGDIVSGSTTSSANHIRTRLFYPISSGFVTYQIADVYEAKIILYDSSYDYIREEPYSNERTFNLTNSGFFKVVVRSKALNTITVAEIETSNLKVANESSATAWNMYFGDLTLEQQKDLYTFKILSRTGLTFDETSSTLQLDALVLLNNVDVTDLMVAQQFAWTRVSKNASLDSQFNALGITGKTLTITSTYLDRSATYMCLFTISESAYLVTKFGNRILTKASNHYLLAITTGGD